MDKVNNALLKVNKIAMVSYYIMLMDVKKQYYRNENTPSTFYKFNSNQSK